VAATGRARDAEVQILRETMLRYMGRRVGKTAAQIRVDVMDDFGSVGERRFYRQLAYLVEVGCARRELDPIANWDRVDSAEDGRAPLVYMYYLVSEKLPPPGVPFCSVCGMLGTTTKTHPLHLKASQERRGTPAIYVPLRDVVAAKRSA
jgi:hypothetical protein